MFRRHTDGDSCRKSSRGGFRYTRRMSNWIQYQRHASFQDNRLVDDLIFDIDNIGSFLGDVAVGDNCPSCDPFACSCDM